MRLAAAWARAGLAAIALLVPGCNRPIPMLDAPEHATVAITGGPNTSMLYLARTTDGVLAIDLGWWGYRSPLARALKTLGATPAEVRWVFLTHSHRDHIAAWPAVRHARFFVGASEQPMFTGAAPHRDWISRWSEKITSSRLPRPGEIAIAAITRDTLIAIGADTMRAYLVPGHTRGSVVYLFRGVLFLGDAVTHSRRGGFAPAKRGFSDDARAGAANLARLWARLPPGAVRHACTAHARCTPFTPEFIAEVGR